MRGVAEITCQPRHPIDLREDSLRCALLHFLRCVEATDKLRVTPHDGQRLTKIMHDYRNELFSLAARFVQGGACLLFPVEELAQVMSTLSKTVLQLLNVSLQGRPLRGHLPAQLVTLNRPFQEATKYSRSMGFWM